MLPYYSRLAATLQSVMPDVCTELCNRLENAAIRSTSDSRGVQAVIENKTRLGKHIGELVKFGVFDKANALAVMQVQIQ